MAPTLQIAIDCVDPHALVKFWATEADVTEVDGQLAWSTTTACRDPERKGPWLLFQVVPEGTGVE